MRVSDLARAQKEIVVKVDDTPEGMVKVVYKPNALTLEVSDRIKEIMATGFEADVALVMLEPLLVAWDLTDDNGQQLPVNAETIKKVPLSFLGLLIAKIEEDSRPNPQIGAISGDTSPSAGGQVVPLSGISSSEQPSTTDAGRGTSLISP